MKQISYGKTEQFRNVVSTINRSYNYKGKDVDGQPIYDPTMKKPKLIALGTVKLHGTNASLVYNDVDGLYTQSKNNNFKLSQVDSHMGFTMFVNKHKDVLLNLIDKIKVDNNIDTSEMSITVYGEWAGSGIQKIVSISELPKSFYIFGIKVSKPSDPDFTSYWVDPSRYRFEGVNTLWNLFEFKTYEVEIDFENPGIAQNRFNEIVDEIENECPVAKELGVSGIGEGAVFKFDYKGDNYKFKVKGEKHSKSKVKTNKNVDVEAIARLQEVADLVTPSWRLEQFFNEVTDFGKNMHRKKIADFIRAVIKDIQEEDLDLLIKHNVEGKDVNKYISTIVKDYFFMMEKDLFGK